MNIWSFILMFILYVMVGIFLARLFGNNDDVDIFIIAVWPLFVLFSLVVIVLFGIPAAMAEWVKESSRRN